MSKTTRRDPLSQLYDEGLKAFRNLEQVQSSYLDTLGQTQLALLEAWTRLVNRQIEALGNERPLPELYEETAREWMDLGNTLSGNLQSLMEHASALQGFDAWGGLRSDLQRERPDQAA
ncbi:MAG: hypothetical protein D6786_01130 [Gammaproteobacteria bacterium]|nr:MAG: hypothetical protein D6786_01130 [Gammaproteobacteria bacterium]